MNYCAIQQKSFGGCDEIWTAAGGRCAEKKETVVCPKPRRLGLSPTSLDPVYARPLRWYASHQQEDCDSKAGNELLDLILAKGGSGSGLEQSSVAQVASSPPFYSGSPPTRVSNPLIQDARFLAPVSPRASPSSTRKGGCVRSSFGNNPGVRIEGFDCLDRDRRNCTIPALA